MSLAVTGADISLELSHPGGRWSVKPARYAKVKIVISFKVAGGRSWEFQETFSDDVETYVKDLDLPFDI